MREDPIAERRSIRPCSRPLHGFTLVELLVVIALIAILMAFLLPGLHAARETARSTLCRNNLRQLGQALSKYELANRTFPPSTDWVAGTAAPFNQPWTTSSWMTGILPQLGFQSLVDRLDRSKSLADPVNRPYRSANVEVMLCPTDSFNRTPFNGTKWNMGDGWARGNYAVNAAQVTMDGAGAASTAWKNTAFRGMMQCGVAVGAAMVRDGLSNTIMLCELRVGLEAIDPRGTWAMGDSASSVWGAGSFHWNEGGPWPGADCNGPNPANAFRMDQDNIVSCRDIFNSPMRDLYFTRELMGCWPDSSTANNSQSAVRSRHSGGIFVCMGDGSVRFITDYIDTNGRIARNPPLFSVWDRLMASADGELVSVDSF